MSKVVVSERHADAEWVHDNLYAYNLSKTGAARQEIRLEPNPAFRTFLFCRDEAGTDRVGGCVWRVRDEDRTIVVEFLWLAESARGLGGGSKLLEAVEAAACRLGCAAVELTTNTFQAPGFYQKHGYVETGRKPSPGQLCPDNIHYTFRKPVRISPQTLTPH